MRAACLSITTLQLLGASLAATIPAASLSALSNDADVSLSLPSYSTLSSSVNFSSGVRYVRSFPRARIPTTDPTPLQRPTPSSTLLHPRRPLAPQILQLRRLSPTRADQGTHNDGHDGHYRLPQRHQLYWQGGCVFSGIGGWKGDIMVDRGTRGGYDVGYVCGCGDGGEEVLEELG